MSASAFRRVWAAPLLLALLSLFALLAALLGSGVWRLLAWAALTLPIAVALRHGLFPAPASRRAPSR